MVQITAGNVHLIAAEELPSGGKVIASGTSFFSDFEMAGDNRYANIDIADKMLDWLAPEEIVELKTIGEVRAGMPENFGQKFAIEGTVTSMSEAYSKEHNLNNTFFEVIYVQDETGGMTIFGVSNTKLPLGTKVRIIGTTDEYQGDYQLRISDETRDLIILDEPIKEIEPKTMSTEDSILKSNEGLLVKVQGRVTELVIDGGETDLYLDDGTGVARVYVQGYIGDGSGDETSLGQIDKDIRVGDIVSAIGLASSDPVGPRLRVRNSAEIVKIGYSLVIGTTEKVEEGEALTVRVNVRDFAEEETSGVMIIKLIDDNGRAYKVEHKDVKMTKGQNTVTFNLELSNYPKGIKEIKVYIWDSLDNMKPLAQAK